jgi:hypothetical protein
LVNALPDALLGREEALRTWTLNGTEQTAFPAPSEAVKRDWSASGLSALDRNLALAYALSGHFELPYSILRTTLFDYLSRSRWCDSKA